MILDTSCFTCLARRRRYRRVTHTLLAVAVTAVAVHARAGGSQVQIEVEDSDEAVGEGVVEAGTVGTVEVAAALFDPNDSTANGCDPAGCTASLTRVRIFARRAP